MNKLILSIGFSAILTLAFQGFLGAQPIVVSDLHPGNGDQGYFIPRVTLPGNRLLFHVFDASGNCRVHAYTAGAGINAADNLTPNFYSILTHNSVTNGKAMYQGGMTAPYQGAQPWVSDGTQPGTTQLVAQNTSCGYFSSVKATEVYGIGYLALGAPKCRGGGGGGATGIGGAESWLYTTNGTTTGTSKLKSWSTSDISSGTANYLPLNGICIFTQWNGTSRGIWKTNGTSKGTTMLRSFTVGGIGPAVVCNNRYIFVASDANGAELWKTDGTANGTTLAADVYTGAPSSSPDYLTVLGNDVYFAATTANGKRLFKYTSPAGPLTQIPMEAADPMWLTVMDGQLYFSAYTASQGRELWVYNPSSTSSPNPCMVGTGIGAGSLSGDPHYAELTTPNMRNEYDRFFAQLNGYLYFGANDGSGYKLWRSNGTTVSEVVGANTGLSRHNSFTVMAGRLYFVARDEVNGFQLYEYTPIVPKQGQGSAVADKITLDQNYPNPFNPSTEISFTLPQAAEVTLVVTDALGREVARLCDAEHRQAGQHSLTFDARDLPSGLYMYRLESAGLVRTRKMLLMR